MSDYLECILGFRDQSNLPGLSINYDKETSVPTPNSGYSSSNRLLEEAENEELTEENKGAPYMTDYGESSTQGMKIEVKSITNNKIQANLYGKADNPIVNPSAAIDWNFNLVVDITDPLLPEYKISGTQDGFPAYEIYIESTFGDITDVYTFDPQDRTVASLAPILHDETLADNLTGEIK